MKVPLDVLLLIVACFGGVAKYLDTYLRGQEHITPLRFFSTMVVCGFTGWLSAEVMLLVYPDWAMIAARNRWLCRYSNHGIFYRSPKNENSSPERKFRMTRINKFRLTSIILNCIIAGLIGYLATQSGTFSNDYAIVAILASFSVELKNYIVTYIFT